MKLILSERLQMMADAVRMGDTTAHGGQIVLGCPTVIIGGYEDLPHIIYVYCENITIFAAT